MGPAIVVGHLGSFLGWSFSAGSVGSVGHILYIYIYNYINIVGLLMYWDIVYVFGFIEAFFFGDAGEMLGGTPTGLLSELAGPEGGDSIPFQVKVRVR